MRALVALGRLDEARAQLRRLSVEGGTPHATELWAAAALGEDATALRLRIHRVPRPNAPDIALAEWFVAALTGDRAEANRRAAAVDASAVGPLRLVIFTGRCHCGAPFDLEATPNFKARLAESGLPWPPVEPPAQPRPATGAR